MQNTATFNSPDMDSSAQKMSDQNQMDTGTADGQYDLAAANNMGFFVNEQVNKQTKQLNRSDLQQKSILYGNQSNLQDVAYIKWLRQNNGRKLKITTHKEMVSAHSIKDGGGSQFRKESKESAG